MTNERVEVREGSKPSTCPYCHDVLASAAVWECPRCRTAHHAECARSHGTCTVLGCGAAFERPVALVHGHVPRPELVRPHERPGRLDADRHQLIALVVVIVFLVGAAALAFVSRSLSRPATTAPVPAPASRIDFSDELFAEARAELDRIQFEHRATDDPAVFDDVRENTALRELAAAQVGSGRVRADVESSIRAALRARVQGPDPRAIEAVVRDAFSIERRDRAKLARRIRGTTSWAQVAPGTRYVLETSGGAPIREVRTRPAGDALEVNHLEGWLVVTPLGERIVETPAGRFACRHFEGVRTGGGRDLPRVEVWVAPELPVPVKSVVVEGGVTTTTVLVAIEKP